MSCLAFLGLLVFMAATLAWHPHFLPATAALALVIVSGLALIISASWRIIRGPDRRRALACLLVGAAPLWFLAGFFLYGLAVVTGQKLPINVATRLLAPLALSVMDLDARLVYPQRTAGEKVVMISAPMPEADARAQVAAMDRHVGALEARLNRKIPGRIHWVRGPLFGIGRRAIIGMCMGTRPGDESPDAEGLCTTDRHEVAHCVLTGQCAAGFSPPAVLTEGWAQANQGSDRLLQAFQVRGYFEEGRASPSASSPDPTGTTGTSGTAYLQGASLVNFLLDRFGPDRFVQLYTECGPSTFESDCRRILGLDLDGLDAAFRADIERRTTLAGPDRAPAARAAPASPRPSKADDWKAFLADYFAAAERLLAPYQPFPADGRLDGIGHRRPGPDGDPLVRGPRAPFGRVRQPATPVVRATNWLSSPIRGDRSRATATRRTGPGRSRTTRCGRPIRPAIAPFAASTNSTPPGGTRRCSSPWPTSSPAWARPITSSWRRWSASPRRAGPGCGSASRTTRRPTRRSPGGRRRTSWPRTTCTRCSPSGSRASARTRTTYQSEFIYDRHEGIPVLRSVHTAIGSPDGSRGTIKLEVVDRRFGPIPEEEFDPDRFLDGPQVTETQPDPYADASLDAPGAGTGRRFRSAPSA